MLAFKAKLVLVGHARQTFGEFIISAPNEKESEMQLPEMFGS